MITIDGKDVFETIDEIVRPEHCALLVIDVQNAYFSGMGACHRHGFDIRALQQTFPRMRQVVEEARAAGVFVVYLREVTYPNSMTDSPASLRFRIVRYGLDPNVSFEPKGSWDAEIVSEIAPDPDEIVIDKHRSSGFIATSL